MIVSRWEILEEHQSIVKRRRPTSSRSFGRRGGLGEGTGVEPLEKEARSMAERLIVGKRIRSRGEATSVNH